MPRKKIKTDYEKGMEELAAKINATDFKTLVLAGNYEQFKNYVETHSMSVAHMRNHIYGESVEKIVGRNFTNLVTIGTFWDKENAQQIYDIAISRLHV